MTRLFIKLLLLLLFVGVLSVNRNNRLRRKLMKKPESFVKRFHKRSEEDSEECDEDHDEEEEEEEDDGPTTATTNIVKAIAMIIILAVSMAFGLLPLSVDSNHKHKNRIASLANCFGGGVFFGTCFLHLIPEVKLQINEFIETLTEECNPPMPIVILSKFPLAEFLECSGFLLILSIEKIAESAKKIRPLTQKFSIFISNSKLQAARQLARVQPDLEVMKEECEDHEPDEKDGCEGCQSEGDSENVASENRKKSEDLSIQSDRSGKKVKLPKAFLSAMKDNLYNTVPNRGPEEIKVPGNNDRKSATLLIIALSIHSFFEGLAIGVETTQPVFIQLAAAITVHKCVIAFAVGSRLIHSGKSTMKIILYLGCMCIMTPIGVSLAILIVTQLKKQVLLIVSGSIQGISTGFFLYITFAEMLFQEMKSKQDSFLKVFFITFGVFLVTASTIWHNWNGAHEGH